MTYLQKISDIHYIGEKEVLEELKFYEDRFTKELGSHGWTVDDWESGEVIDNDSFYRRINAVIDNLNSVTEKYNCFVFSQ